MSCSSEIADNTLCNQSDSTFAVMDSNTCNVSDITVMPCSGLESRSRDNVRAQSFESGPIDVISGDEETA